MIGHPIRHSLSPVIHNAAYADLGLDWVYVAFDVADGAARDALGAMAALQLAGLNVTMPHKSAVAALVDVLTEEAAALASVNTVTRLPDGRLEGHSTDGPGFLDALREAGVPVVDRRVGVVGAGGAARAVIGSLAAAGAGEVVVVNRSRPAADRAAALAGSRGRVGADEDALAQVDLLVNAIPVGMDGVSLPVPAHLVHAGQDVVDLIYHPPVTPLLELAEARGARAVNGLGMLVHQAAHSFRRWTGLDPPVDVMRSAALVYLAARG